MNKAVTILVNSCDRYEDAWEPFFRLLSVQWKDCPYKIVLNTEHKVYTCDYLNVQTIQTGNEKSWTERIKAALKIIDSEFVLFCLEDFFFLSPVNIESWNKVINIMIESEKIGFVWFPPNKVLLNKISVKKITSYLNLTKKSYNFRVSASLGLWRKEFLLQMLFRDGDPWYFEWSAPKLSRYSEYQCTFWNQEMNRIFDYEIRPESGYGIVRGKWLPRNKDLFSKYGINVNYDNLGLVSIEEAKKSMGVEKKVENKFLRKIKVIKKSLKRNVNDIKRFFKLYPAFKKYCKNIKLKNQKP